MPLVSSDREHLFVLPAIIVSAGGFGGSVNLVTKSVQAPVFRQVGASWTRHVHVDFANAADPAPPALSGRYRIELLTSAEKVELESGPVREIAASGLDKAELSPLWALASRSTLAASFSQQAGQVPSIGRAALWLKLQPFATQVENSIRQLSALQLTRSGLESDQIGRSIEIWVVAGAQGGTGTGAFLLAALVISAVAKMMGVNFSLNGWVAFGYRAMQDAEADRRIALGEQLALDLEAAQNAGARLSVVAHNGREYSTVTPLFKRIVVSEGHGRLHADAGALAMMIGSALAFRGTTLAAHNIDTAAAENILSRMRNEGGL